MDPRVVLEGFDVRRSDGIVTVVAVRDGVVDEGSARTLSPAAGQLLDLADGSRDIATLHAAVGGSKQTLWAAFDELADIGVLRSRVTPPVGDASAWGAPTNRRRLLRNVGLAAGVIVGTGLVGTARAAATNPAQEEQQQKEHAEKDAEHAEKDAKHAEKDAKHAAEHAEKAAKQADDRAEKDAKHAVRDAQEAASKEARRKAH